jgi:hypothetical protein
VFSTSPTLIQDGQSGYLVGRVAADPWDWRLEFKLKMLGAYGWQPYAQSAKKSMQQLLVPKETTNAIRLETLRKSAKAHAASAQRNH